MENPLGQRLLQLPGPLLITGHTGFKGTWMTLLLEYLKIPAVGYSLPAEINSLFELSGRTGLIPEIFGDVRDYGTLEQFIDNNKPSVIVHMAAQPLVLKSYDNPLETFDVNVMGTANVLDIAFKKDYIKTILVVTTDKVYKNDNTGSLFSESDPLEGKDPYSSSKVGTESVVKAWQQIANLTNGPRVVSVRAGNVIGGGDFARDRIIPDIVRGIKDDKEILIRNPKSLRPWQHVLDPLIGYIKALETDVADCYFERYNFGPTEYPITVSEVVRIAREVFPKVKIKIPDSPPTEGKLLEAKALALNSTLARQTLDWDPLLDQESSIRLTFEWWRKLFNNYGKPEELCNSEIKHFLTAHERRSRN
jgi:CDP-glucose 4,6-dehydratase